MRKYTTKKADSWVVGEHFRDIIRLRKGTRLFWTKILAILGTKESSRSYDMYWNYAIGYSYPNVPGIYTSEQVEAWKPIVKVWILPIILAFFLPWLMQPRTHHFIRVLSGLFSLPRDWQGSFLDICVTDQLLNVIHTNIHSSSCMLQYP